MMNGETTETQEAPEEKPHEAPSTPGWKLMLEAAQAVLSENPRQSDLAMLRAHLYARKNEHIPEAHKKELMDTLATVACRLCSIAWPDEFTEFFHAQLGKEALSAMLEGSGYEIHDCPSCEGSGYHVMSDNPDPDMLFDAMFLNFPGPAILIEVFS